MRKTAKICQECKSPLRMLDKHENSILWYCDECEQSRLPLEDSRDVPSNTNMGNDFPSGDNSSSFHAANKQFLLKKQSIDKIIKIADKLDSYDLFDISDELFNIFIGK